MEPQTKPVEDQSSKKANPRQDTDMDQESTYKEDRKRKRKENWQRKKSY